MRGKGPASLPCRRSWQMARSPLHFFHSLCLCLIFHACAYFTNGNRREVSTSTIKLFIRHLEYFQISSNVIALAYALFSCACFTCDNVASLCLCSCLCLSHKWEPGCDHGPDSRSPPKLKYILTLGYC